MNFLMDNILNVLFKRTFIFSGAFIVKASKGLYFLVGTYHGNKSVR